MKDTRPQTLTKRDAIIIAGIIGFIYFVAILESFIDWLANAVTN